jgi:putative endonuclease
MKNVNSRFCGKWSVYMVRCADGSLYTGIAIDVGKRVALHNAGKGAKYTRSRLPVALVWCAEMKNATDARKTETDVKRLSKKEKEKLISFERRGDYATLHEL